MPAEIIVDRFRMAALRYTGDDPGLLAASKLPLHAGLASRVRCMILNGSSDETVDLYIDGWIEASDGGER
jgi:hypothetical protein